MAEFSPAEGIKTLLTGAAGLEGYTLIVGHGVLEDPRVITCVDTGGPPSNPKWLLDFPTVQVIVRGEANEYKTVWTVCKAIKDYCLGITSQAVNGDTWVSVNLLSDIAFIGRDENNRPMFSVNFDLIIQPQTNAQTQRLALT